MVVLRRNVVRVVAQRRLHNRLVVHRSVVDGCRHVSGLRLRGHRGQVLRRLGVRLQQRVQAVAAVAVTFVRVVLRKWPATVMRPVTGDWSEPTLQSSWPSHTQIFGMQMPLSHLKSPRVHSACVCRRTAGRDVRGNKVKIDYSF